MNSMTRRSTFGLLGGSAVALTVFGCAQDAERSAAPAPPAASPPPASPSAAPSLPWTPTAAGAELRAAFTESDRALYQDCINKTMRAPVGRVWRWRNPQSGNGGSMAPTSAPQVASNGQTCRSFNETITLNNGRTETLNGQACQRADGSWSIVA
jgi:surface antigen